jgi:hypothetical protein
VIASVQPGAGTTRVTIQVSRPGTPGEQAVLLVSAQTEVTVRAADGASPGDMLDLVPGARIDARHTGAELRSLPRSTMQRRSGCWVGERVNGSRRLRDPDRPVPVR